MAKLTYLCGGINGLSDAECRDWRESAKASLKTDTLDPMRRDYRGREDNAAAEIVAGDIDDIDKCRFVLVNAVRPSWGTAMEVFYAHRSGAIVVSWTGDASVSPWLRHHSHYVTPSLGQAIQYINERA